MGSIRDSMGLQLQWLGAEIIEFGNRDGQRLLGLGPGFHYSSYRVPRGCGSDHRSSKPYFKLKSGSFNVILVL